MVNLLIGNRNTQEVNSLYHGLTNDKSYMIQNTNSGIDTLSIYWKINPDILILDDSLNDMSIEYILEKLSDSPVERKKCNTILTVTSNYNIKLNDVSKVNKIFYKPLIEESLINAITSISTDFFTPDLTIGEVDWILQSLNFNCMSDGYKFMKDAITYCYYNPFQLQFLNNIHKILADKYNVTESRVKDAMTSCIRPLNKTNFLDKSSYLYKMLYYNNYSKQISPKDFIERIVLYLTKKKKKGRLF